MVMNDLKEKLSRNLANIIYLAIPVIMVTVAYFVALSHQKPRLNINSIVRLYNPETDRFVCSGVVISKTLILTAKHCFSNISSGYLRVRSLDGKSSLGSALYYTEKLDWILINGNFKDFTVAKTETKFSSIINSFNLEEYYTSCGFPNGTELTCLTYNDVSYYDFMARSKELKLYPSMSGGPIFNTKTGEVIGVNSKVNEEYSYFELIIGLETLLGFKI
jgi:hypothetical protein